MKVKTAELEGAALASAVGEAAGLDIRVGTFGPLFGKGYRWACVRSQLFDPTDNRDNYGSRIIDTALIATRPTGGLYWTAQIGSGPELTGKTRLIAAMRCYVQAQRGDEVEVPDELAEIRRAP
jgi:hypothetical protein